MIELGGDIALALEPPEKRSVDVRVEDFFSATHDPSVREARKTVAVAPRPSSSSSTYGPSRAPTLSSSFERTTGMRARYSCRRQL